MSQNELLLLAQRYLVEQAMIVVIVLLVIGYFLKSTPVIKDWLIPWLLTGIGILMAWGVFEAISIQSTIQGILAAGMAILIHQLWKQTAGRYSKNESRK